MKRTALFTTLAVALGVGITTTATHTVSAADQGVGTVNYVKGFGIALWKQPGAQPTARRLTADTSWLVSAGQKAANGRYYFNLGGSQYVDSAYFDLNTESSSQSLNGVGRVFYTPGFGIALWNAPNGKAIAGRTLPHWSAWKITSRKVVNGQSWYELGRNQWIQGKYFKLIKETKRGNKQFVTDPVTALKKSIAQEKAKLEKTRIKYTLPWNPFPLKPGEGSAATGQQWRLQEFANEFRRQSGLSDKQALIAAQMVIDGLDPSTGQAAQGGLMVALGTIMTGQGMDDYWN